MILSQFKEELAKVKKSEREAIEAAYPSTIEAMNNNDKNWKFNHPVQYLATIIRILKYHEKYESLNICPRCGGTGFYQGKTNHTDIKGKPFCFACGGAGESIGNIPKEVLNNLDIMLKKYMTFKTSK